MVIPNTLAVDASALRGCIVTNIEELQAARAAARNSKLVWLAMGQASNVVLYPRLERFVGLIRIPGIAVLNESSRQITLRVGAGEDWHGLVQYCVRHGWYGIENLALIPGTVGAAPVQNIGAYGIEVADWVAAIEVVDERGRVAEIAPRDCEFAYRASRFQSSTDLCISHVHLQLNKAPSVVTTYTDLAEELARAGTKRPAPIDVFDAVVRIRSRKLPDPRQVPNVGSFFKNPIIAPDLLQTLRGRFPDLKAVATSEQSLKLSAAQLIDLAGWKARQDGPVRCWHLQPLVLTNVEGADAATVLAYAEAIRRDIEAKFGIYLELEPSVFS